MTTAILFPEYKQLVKAAADWDYGSLHSHEEIAKILKLPVQSRKYYSAITSANKQLLDKQKLLKSVPKTGYEVLKPEEYTHETIHRLKQSKRQANRALKIAQLAPIDKMSITAATKHRTITDRVLAYTAMASGLVVEAKVLTSK